MVAITSRSAFLAVAASVGVVSLLPQPVAAAPIVAQAGHLPARATTAALELPSKAVDEDPKPKPKPKHGKDEDDESSESSSDDKMDEKKDHKKDHDKDDKKHHKSRFAGLVPQNPSSELFEESQTVFSVLSKAIRSKIAREPDHHPRHHHHHGYHVSDEKGSTYTVAERRSDGNADGRIDVMADNSTAVGSLWYSPSEDAMFVSDTNATTFTINCPFADSDPHGYLCQFAISMYDNAQEVSRCVTFDDTTGSMHFKPCNPTGDNQTFIYDVSNGVVKPAMGSAIPSNDSSTANSSMASNDTQAANATTFDRREDQDSGGHNVTLVFVPNDPLVPQVNEVDDDANATTTYTMTSTAFVTVTTADSSMETGLSSSHSRSASASITSSGSSPSATSMNAMGVEVFSVTSSSASSSATGMIFSTATGSESAATESTLVTSTAATSDSTSASMEPTSTGSDLASVAASIAADVDVSA